MRTYYIYKATDLTNNKVYIGKTSQFSERKWQHERCYEKDDCLFHRAIKAHGKNNFKWEIIDKADNLSAAYELEMEYISKFNSLKPNGYNMTKGGAGGSMWNARPVICLSLDGEFVKRYDSASQANTEDGFCASDVLSSCKNTRRTCKNHIFMFEDEYLERGARRYERPVSKSRKSIVQCDLNGNFINEFSSVKDAAKQTSTCRTTISGVLTGTYKSANGFIFVYKENFPIKDAGHFQKKKKGKKIIQIDPKTNSVVNKFDRVSDAGKALGVNYKSIHKVIDIPTRTAYGYRWVSQ